MAITKSKRPEEILRSWFVSVFTERAGGYAQPIESRPTGLGISDLYAIMPGSKKPFWVEFKVCPDIDQAISFEPGQLNWMYKHHNAGGRSLVLIQVEELIYIVPITYIDRTTNHIRHPALDKKYILRIAKKHLVPGLEIFLEQLDKLLDYDRN